MLPKWHVLFDFVFAYIIYWFTSITIFQASLIFLASVFIDFDHYLWYRFKKKDWNLKNSYGYLKTKERLTKKLMIFHTIEFHIFIGLLIFFWHGFLFILIGMIFHSICDLISMFYEKTLYTREFLLIRAILIH